MQTYPIGLPKALFPSLFVLLFTGCLNSTSIDHSIPVEQVGPLHPVDGEGLRAMVAQHQGNVILVDFWATWCGPCVHSFPHTVELSHKYGKQGLSVISVSMNDPEDSDDVLAFLAKHGADIENCISADGGSQTAYEEFGVEGGIPFYRVYDRDGNEAHTFLGSTDGMEDLIEQLLAQLP